MSNRVRPVIVDWAYQRFQLNNQVQRDAWVREKLAKIPAGLQVLDAGCGTQRYRDACSHLIYTSQDFGQYTTDARTPLGSGTTQSAEEYLYGPIDIIGDIWSIPRPDNSFDAILCTEVLEHVPYPIDTIAELSRLLSPEGTLILTVPSNALRHHDPYYYTSGLSDRWIERVLPEHGLEIQELTNLGDYYSWMKVEIARTAGVHGWWARILLASAFLFFATRRPTPESTLTMNQGYMVVARKT